MKTNLFILLLLICLSIPFMASAQTVYIPDPNLRAAIKFALSGNSDWDRPFTELEEFSLTSSSVSNLTGLETCNQPGRPESSDQQYIKPLTSGGLDQPDRAVAS